MTEVEMPFGMNFNISVVINDEGIEMGMRYNDSNDVDIDGQASGDSIEEVAEALFDDFVSGYISATTKPEPEPMSEIDELKAELQQLKEENARLEHRLQEQFPKQVEEKPEKETGLTNQDLADYLNDILDLLNTLYK